ncbi:hypothetical protein SLEP1_g47066 [Rubroshorea leprosula]|uniref:AP-5 complex subunit beta-1 n=1 Tax=Rubroshorea leprosula TaxID=152421 RepID=A0AAV5LRT5_9ROSI|nr:hypothetical protein SLEP1_g47066 [Rubroshorea leprosula]
MVEKPPTRPLTPQDWEALIDDFQYGGSRREKWSSLYPTPVLLDLAFSSLLRKDFPLKIPLLVFLEEFSLTLFNDPVHLDRLVELLTVIVQSPLDNIHITYALKEQMMVSATSILISINSFEEFDVRFTENVVELLLAVINRTNPGSDRHTRGIACECLRELEKSYPCLLSDVAGHLWSLCQSERTHASQSYILLFATVIYNIVNQKLSISILNTSVPLVPFCVPQRMLGSSSGLNKEVSGLNYKELRRAMAFLLEWPRVMTPSGMMEFMAMIMPIAVALELQASMLKVQFFGMIYSFSPALCHTVLMMYLHFFEAFDGQELDIVRRLILVSRETQQFLVFRLLSVHWLLGLLNKLVLDGEIGKKKSIVDMGFLFYPTVFDPLSLKALKLDLLAFCSVCFEMLKDKSVSGEVIGDGNPAVKLFEDGLFSVSAFKWMPSWSTETAVAFRVFHKFLIGASSHSDADPSTTRILMESTIFRTLKKMLVDLMLEFQRLVPVTVAFIDRLLGCQRHCWLGESLLQTIDNNLLPRVTVDYRLVSYIPILDRIAENDTIPPHGLLDLLTKFMIFLVEKHGPDTGVRSWSRGSKVLGICRTMLSHHHSSRLFLGLSHLLAFTCLYFPDLEVRDHARIFLRMLICLPGAKLRSILNLEEQMCGISPSPQSFFNAQTPRYYDDLKKSGGIASYIHLERVIPLLVKQSWSLSLSPLGVGSTKLGFLDSIRDNEASMDEMELDNNLQLQTLSETDRMVQPQEPLRVMDSKVSEILQILRRHFSCIPDYRYMPALKVKIPCSLSFESEPFNHVWGGESPRSGLEGVDALPAIYATVLKFSSSASYGSIPSCHIPFLLGQPSRSTHFSGQTVSLDIVPLENGSGDDETYKAPLTIELEPREPTPGLVNVLIEANAENGQIIQGQLKSITVGIEDMFLKAIAPSDIAEDALAGYYSELFDALWDACGASSNTGRETFPLKGGKGVAAISGTRSVKLLEVPADSLIQATEHYLAPFVVSVVGEQLVSILKDQGFIKDIIWKDSTPDSLLDATTSVAEFGRGLLQLTYTGDDDKDEKESHPSITGRKLGFIHVLIFLPPRFHLLFQMEVSDISTLVRIRTDYWPCLAYIDDYLEALFLS